MVCGKPLYFFKITVVPLHFHCLSAACICSVLLWGQSGSHPLGHFYSPLISTVQSRRLTERIVLQHPQYPRTQKMLLYILHSAYLYIW